MSEITPQTAKEVKVENPAITGTKQEIKRNPDGTFPEGVSGNPAGKPKGVRHLSTLLEEAIRRVAEDTGTPEDVAIVKKVIEKAKGGDMKAIEHIWDRLEGKAPQTIDITTDGDKISASSIPLELIKEFEEKLRKQIAE